MVQWKRAIEVLQREGLRSLWFKLLAETVYRRLQILACPIEDVAMNVKATIPINVAILRDHEVDQYLAFRPQSNSRRVTHLLETGHICVVARHEGRIVHAWWGVTGRAWIDYLGCEMPLAPDEVYGSDVFTHPDYRRKNIAAARHSWMAAYFRQAGYRRLLGSVLPENRIGVKYVSRMGFRSIGLRGWFKLGSRRWEFMR